MTDLTRYGASNRPLVPITHRGRTIAAFEQSALEKKADAALNELDQSLYTQFVENRIADTKEVLTFAKAAIQDEADKALILPIVEAYGLRVQRDVMNYGRGL